MDNLLTFLVIFPFFFVIISAIDAFIHWTYQKRWQDFASQNNLSFEPASLRPLSSTKDKIKGRYKKYKLLFTHKRLVFYSKSRSPTTVITIPLRRSKGKEFVIQSKWLTDKTKKITTGHADFDKQVFAQSTPPSFLSDILKDETLAKDILVAYSFTLCTKLELDKKGNLTLTHEKPFNTAAKLEYALDLLCDLADVIEEVAKSK